MISWRVSYFDFFINNIYILVLDELPMELRDRCTEMRQLDLEVQSLFTNSFILFIFIVVAGQERINKAILEYFDNSAQLTDDQKKENYEMLQKVLIYL